MNVKYTSQVTPLWLAVARDYLESARDLLKHGANVDERYRDMTPLIWASQWGQVFMG